jgi:hypothetical protein
MRTPHGRPKKYLGACREKSSRAALYMKILPVCPRRPVSPVSGWHGSAQKPFCDGSHAKLRHYCRARELYCLI